MTVLFLTVEKVTILQPNDKEIVSHDVDSDNIYQRIVAVMKQSTQEYYNMRIVLGLKVAWYTLISIIITISFTTA